MANYHHLWMIIYVPFWLLRIRIWTKEIPASWISVQFSSVTQPGPTLWDAMDFSMLGFPVHHQLPELIKTNIHWVGDAIQLSHPVIPVSSCLQSFPASGSFPVNQFFASCDQSIRVSASASVLPMNIQDWFPLGWIGWISLLSKGLSRVFSNTPVQKHHFFCTESFLYGLILTSIHDHSFEYMDLCR